MRITAIILILILTSCLQNSKEISKVFNGSTIKATLVYGKFDGVVEQTFHDKDFWIKSISTYWVSGDLKKIVLIDSKKVSHEMRYYERKGTNDSGVTITYRDVNDPTFATLPFNDDFTKFCAEHAFLSTKTLTSFDSTIKIFNVPEHSYRAMSSPLPIRIEDNSIRVINNGYVTDSLHVTLHWFVGESKTDYKIRVEKNVR